MNIDYKSEFDDLCSAFDQHYEENAIQPFDFLARLRTIADKSGNLNLLIRSRKYYYIFCEIHHDIAAYIPNHLWLCQAWENDLKNEYPNSDLSKAFVCFEKCPSLIFRFQQWDTSEQQHLIDIYKSYAAFLERPLPNTYLTLLRIYKVLGWDDQFKVIQKKLRRCKEEIDFEDHFLCDHCQEGGKIIYYSFLDNLERAVPIAEELTKNFTYCQRVKEGIVVLLESLLEKKAFKKAYPFVLFLENQYDQPYPSNIRHALPVFWYYTLTSNKTTAQKWQHICEVFLKNSLDDYIQNKFSEILKKS